MALVAIDIYGNAEHSAFKEVLEGVDD